MVPIIFSPRYVISAFGLERLHPFDVRKARRIHDELVRRGLRRLGDFTRPRPVGRQDLLKVHTPEYLRSLRRSAVLARVFEIPIVRRLPGWLLDWKVLRPMRCASGGTILACRLALERGVAINLGGGFHHAAAERGGGFCVYADIPIAAATLHAEGRAQRVLVVDLDAHQGDGTASVFREWPWATILDLYQEDNFPPVKEREDFPFPLAAGIAGGDYLDIVRATVPPTLDAVRPDLVIYNAGSDPFEDDPLAGLRLSKSDLALRDLIVVSACRERAVPVALTLSGGYAAESWRIHTDAIEDILTRFDRES